MNPESELAGKPRARSECDGRFSPPLTPPLFDTFPMYSKKLSGGPQSSLKPKGRGRGGSGLGSSRNSSAEHLPSSRSTKDHQHGHKPKDHRSLEVQRIDGLIASLEDGYTDPPPGGGCFCMGQISIRVTKCLPDTKLWST